MIEFPDTFMPKTSSQMKNMIQDYIKITKRPYKETTEEMAKKFSNLDWQILAGNAVHFTKFKSRDDRIDIHYAIGFTEEQSKQLQVGQPDIEKTILEINGLLTSSNLKYEWNVKEGHITGLLVKSFIDEEELSRANVFRIWESIVNHAVHAGKKITLKINPQQTVTKTDENPLAG